MPSTEKNLTRLLHDLEKERRVSIRSTLSSLSPFEIARLLEAIEPRNREILWRMVDREDEGEILKELVDDVRQNLIDQMNTDQIIAATQDLELDDEGFNQCMEEQVKNSKSASKFKGNQLDLSSIEETQILGYDRLNAEGKVLGLWNEPGLQFQELRIVEKL